ncbi:hypothetical protein PFISCL1PPCAC_26342, partial [Pristionchus fissidentatus]
MENNEEFPFQKVNLHVSDYDRKLVGKRWMRVNRITTPFTENENRFDIALMQLEQSIPIKSYIKPICMPLKTEFPKKKMNVARITETLDPKTNLISRVIKNEEFSVSRPSTCKNQQKNQTNDCQKFFLDEKLQIDSISLGSPVFLIEGGQKFFHGFLTKAKKRNVAIRPAYFTTFICIHTGICEDDEDFQTRTFLLYEWK